MRNISGRKALQFPCIFHIRSEEGYFALPESAELYCESLINGNTAFPTKHLTLGGPATTSVVAAEENL